MRKMWHVRISKKITTALFRAVTIFTLLFMIFGNPGNVNAQGNGPSKDLDALSEEFGLVEVTEIPDGITPLVFDSLQDLEKFLIEAEKGTNSTQHIMFAGNGSNGPDIPQVGIETVTYTVVTRRCSTTVAVGTQFNTWADIRIGMSGSSYYTTWIDQVLNTQVGLTGITLGMDLTNEYSYSYNQTSQSVSIAGGGILNIYLVVEGGVRLYSRPVSCSFTYSVN